LRFDALRGIAVLMPRRNPKHSRFGRLALYGALGASYGAGAMTLIRIGLIRAGLLDKMVPQAVTEWALAKMRVTSPRHPASDQLVHLLYSLTWGGLAAPALFGGWRRRSLAVGGTFGLGLWALGPLVLFPLLKIAPPAWKSSRTENLTDIGTHLIYGLAVQLLTEEFARQRPRRPTLDVERFAARVG
jgi:uncharacterized membrane protein YagU involved in acid resistance